MANSNDENNNKEEPKVIIRWKSTPFKPSVYTVSELRVLRKPASPGGSGYLYYNPTRDVYERARSIDMLPPSSSSPRKNNRKSRLSQ